MFNIIKKAALRNDLAFKPKTFQIDFEIGKDAFFVLGNLYGVKYKKLD